MNQSGQSGKLPLQSLKDDASSLDQNTSKGILDERGSSLDVPSPTRKSITPSKLGAAPPHNARLKSVRKKFLKAIDLKKKKGKSNMSMSNERIRSSLHSREPLQDFGTPQKINPDSQNINVLPYLKIPLKSKQKDQG